MKVIKPFGFTRRSTLYLGRALAIAITFYMALGAVRTADAQKFRFFGNTISDWTVITLPAGGTTLRWRILKNENPSVAPGIIRDIPFGADATDLAAAAGDYTGDGLDDFALYRDATGSPANTYLIGRSDGGTIFQPWGDSSIDNIGNEGDYDGDHKMDFSIARGSDGSPYQWWVLRSSNNTVAVFEWGQFDTDIPLAGADYTGDGIDDPTVARVNPTTGLITWYVGTITGSQISQVQWGDFDTDFIVPAGDYDGDHKADYMVWRGFGTVNGVWYLRTSAGATSYTQFGLASGVAANRDIALRSGDYDADGKTDIAIYRPSTLTFWVLRSSGGGAQTQPWGIAGNSNVPLAQLGTF
jgi:hypothetical protein